MTWHLEQGDCRDVLKRWAAEGVRADLVLTDPPYHLASIAKRFGKPGSAPAQHGKDGAAARLSRGFMGSVRDSGDVSFQPETWEVVKNILKPGGRALVFGGTRTFWKVAAAAVEAGFEYEDTIMWVYGQGLVLRKSRLKPSYEPILVMRTPGPVQDLQIDACRVPSELRTTIMDYEHDEHYKTATYSGRQDGSLGRALPGVKTELGRWPANIVHDNSETVVSCFPDTPGQLANAKRDGSPKNNKIYGALNHDSDAAPEPRGDAGSAARFFNTCEWTPGETEVIYRAKASTRERISYCNVCKISFTSEEKSLHVHDLDVLDHIQSHATVKPLSLMRHLARLACPPGGLIIDPFCGSGSTLEAAVLEGFDVMGIELDEIACSDTRRRMERSAT